MSEVFDPLDSICRPFDPLDITQSLVGRVNDRVIDAAAVAESQLKNGFPNWHLFRAAYCGDSTSLSRMKVWCGSFAVAHAECHEPRRLRVSEDVALTAGLDALHKLVHNDYMAPAYEIAEMIGVRNITYSALRDEVYSRIKASLDVYWLHLCGAYLTILARGG